MKIFISVGHSKLKNGGRTSADGTKFGGINEYEYNKKLLVPLVNHLLNAGHQVDAVVCPEGVFTKSTEEKAYKLPLANAKAYDLVMELHLNASASPNTRGFEVLYKTEKGKAYARPIADCLGTLFTPRGDKGLVKRDNLYMLNATKAPAIMLEPFFCTNVQDCAIGAQIDTVAAHIAAGVNASQTVVSTPPDNTSVSRAEFSEYVGAIAAKDWQERHICLPSVVVAQAIKESGAGTSELARNANALFGIKQNGWTGKTYLKQATEQRPDGSYYQVDNTVWRAYDSWEQSILDHNDYIATRTLDGQNLIYQKVIGETDYKKACHALQEAGYATSLTYADSLIKDYIQKDNLSRFDETVKNNHYVVQIGPFIHKEDADSFAAYFTNAEVISC